MTMGDPNVFIFHFMNFLLGCSSVACGSRDQYGSDKMKTGKIWAYLHYNLS